MVSIAEDGGRQEGTRQGGNLRFWLILDFKHYEKGEAEAWERLKAFEFPHSYVIHSGNGLHVYWFFDRVIEPSHKVEAILRA